MRQRKDILFLINDFMDINYLVPLLEYGKKQKADFRVAIVFEHFQKKQKKAFLHNKTTVLNQSFFEDLNIEIFSTTEFQDYFKLFDGVLVSTSGTIFRLKTYVYDNRKCRYVLLSFFNDKVEPILDSVDLAFVSSKKDLQKVSGLNVRVGLPHWDLYSDMNQYDFQHLSPIDIPADTYNIVIPEIMSYENWHKDSLKWIDENYKEDHSYFFKHRIKTDLLRKKNDEFEKSLRKYPNVYHVYDPFFYTTQKLLKNCDEVLFLSNKTLFIYECAKVGIKCRKAYDKALDFYHYDSALIDKYVENKKAVQEEIFPSQKHATEYCFNEVIRMAETTGEQRINKIENVKVIKLEDIDFSKLNFIKGKPRDRQLFINKESKLFVKTWTKDYQWADQLEDGIKSNYYDIKLIPNLYALIKDKNGCNRGYITNKVPDEQLLSNFGNIFSLNNLKKLLLRQLTVKQAFTPRKYRWNQSALVDLLYELFSRALIRKTIFTDIDCSNLWADQGNYYLFDLENCTRFSWFFNDDSNHPEYLRQVIHRDLFNKRLEILFKNHKLLFPMRICREEDLVVFWENFIEINRLKNISRELAPMLRTKY